MASDEQQHCGAQDEKPAFRRLQLQNAIRRDTEPDQQSIGEEDPERSKREVNERNGPRHGGIAGRLSSSVGAALRRILHWSVR